MPNNRLILRKLISPWVTPVADITKSSILTLDDVDNNFIYLRGETLYNIELDAATLRMNKINGTNYEFDFSVLSNGIFTGGTVVGPTNFDAPLSACTYPVYLNNIYPCSGETSVTFNTSISATTVSATTYYGDGSQLTGVITNGGRFTGGTVSGAAYFTSAVTVNNLTVTGDTIFNGPLSACTEGIYVNDLYPCGGSSNIIFNGGISATSISATTLFSGGTELSLVVRDLISNIGTITGDTIFEGNVTFTNNVISVSAISVNNITVSGDSTFNNTTNFTSAVTINNLTVSGNSTFNNTTNFTSAVTINNLTVSGNSTFNNTTNFTSAVTINNLTVSGDSTFNNTTNFTSAVTINELTVTGNTVFSGPISACTSGITTSDIYTCDSGVTVHSNFTYIGQANNPLYHNGSGSTFTIDWDESNIQTITLTGNTQIANPINVKEGASYQLIVKQAPSGPYTINSWGSNFKFESGTYPALSTGTTNVDIITFITDDEGNLYGIGAYDFI